MAPGGGVVWRRGKKKLDSYNVSISKGRLTRMKVEKESCIKFFLAIRFKNYKFKAK